jgi:SAM-dependent methyltransferase
MSGCKYDSLRPDSNKNRILDIGCGRSKYPGSIGLDQYRFSGVDIVSSLEKPLPFNDNEFDVVFANQVLEHIDNIVGLMKEIFRILRPGGCLIAHTPYFRSSWAHIDPTHLRSFTINSLDYFVVGTYCYENYRFFQPGFSKISVYLDYEYRGTLFRKLFSNLALKNPFKYENSIYSHIYTFEQISFVLTK